MVDPNLVIGAGKEVAGAVREHLKKRPTEKQKQVKELFELLRELKTEIGKDERNHHKILHLQNTRDLFIDTVLSGVGNA